MDRISSEQHLASSGDAETMRSLDTIKQALDLSESRSAAYAAQVADHLREIKRQKAEIRQLEAERAVLASAVKEAVAGHERVSLLEEQVFEEVRGENEIRVDEAAGFKASMSLQRTTSLDVQASQTQYHVQSDSLPGLRVLIVTPDIHGPIRNGGIGTAFSALAQQLVAWGAQTTVAYALGRHSESEPIAHWQNHYAGLGIALLSLDDKELSKSPNLGAPIVRQLPWRVYRWLERNQNDFDIAIFPEWMGLAYYALLAKGQGLAFKQLSIVVNTHSPAAWAAEGNRALPERLDFVDRDFMERESVRRADWVISPSHYMLDWMRSRKWELPAQSCVIQNLMPEIVDAPGVPDTLEMPETLVFFGRLEHRKGLKLFCDAIDRLPPERRNTLRAICFLGKAVIHPGGFESRRYISERSRNWSVRVNIMTDKNKDEALAELAQPGVLAVIASLSENSPYTVLECLHHDVRFVAASVGGITELVHPDDAQFCLFPPNPQGLVNCLQNVLTHGAPVIRIAQPQSGTREQWRSWFQEIAQQRAAAASADTQLAGIVAKQPLVSVCLVHYNRPNFLALALASLRAQTYANIEIVLVDDGSPAAEAQRYLESLEDEFTKRDWQIIRQQNSYLGAARNRAAEAARGQYVLFMDDDNIAMPHEVETFMSAAQHSGADVLTCASAVFSETPPAEPSYVWLPLGGAAGAGMFRNVFGDANAFWKRSTYLELGGHTTDYGVGHEDWELFAEAVLSGAKLELVPVPLFWYRVNAKGMLRAGDSSADHARSARAYMRHDPHGLGMASAYAVLLQRATEQNGKFGLLGGGRLARALGRALRMATEPSLRVQFLAVWRNQGLREAVERAMTKANR
jgi:glycosyltransferase involved in cell wall biosynthesis/GT2 family glycosyltransferase